MSSNNIGSILYKNDLVEKVISVNSESEIVKEQEKSNTNVMSGEIIDDQSKNNMLLYLGSKDEPFMINIYPKDFNSKDEIIRYLDKYNQRLNEVVPRFNLTTSSIYVFTIYRGSCYQKQRGIGITYFHYHIEYTISAKKTILFLKTNSIKFPISLSKQKNRQKLPTDYLLLPTFLFFKFL